VDERMSRKGNLFTIRDSRAFLAGEAEEGVQDNERKKKRKAQETTEKQRERRVMTGHVGWDAEKVIYATVESHPPILCLLPSVDQLHAPFPLLLSLGLFSFVSPQQVFDLST